MLYGNLRPSPPEQIFEHSDKAGHGISFMLLAISAKLAMFTVRPALLWTLLFIFAFVLEYLQGITRPLRQFSFSDVYANLFGVFLALIFMVLWKKVAPQFLPTAQNTLSKPKV